MPVIGRLDKQVEEVLISPLDKTGRHETAKHTTAQQDEETRDALLPTQSSNHESIPRQTEKEELPVWLL